jgi:transposase-like protein
MELDQPQPTSLVEAIRYFSDPDVCLQYMVRLRWPNGVHCPICGRSDPLVLKRQRRWECRSKHPKRQFSCKTGTIMEDSPLGLDKWFVAMWLLTCCKNGVSSMEIHRDLKITQKSAWHLLHRIRLAMKTGNILKTPDDGGGNGEYEADETFIGGLASNMHKGRRERLIKGRGTIGKEIVMGILLRGTPTKPSRVVSAKRVPNTTMAVLQAEVRAAVERGSKLYTDSLRSYNGLAEDYIHEVVDHAVEYVRNRVHTNSMENF